MLRLITPILNVALAASVIAFAAPVSTAGESLASASGPTKTAPRCATHVVVDESANGSTVCVALGSDLTVMLHGSGWTAPDVTGNALSPGRGIPTPANVVGWSFTTLVAGTAQISLSRPDCPQAKPGAGACTSRFVYRVHVDVR